MIYSKHDVSIYTYRHHSFCINNSGVGNCNVFKVHASNTNKDMLPDLNRRRIVEYSDAFISKFRHDGMVVSRICEKCNSADYQSSTNLDIM